MAITLSTAASTLLGGTTVADVSVNVTSTDEVVVAHWYMASTLAGDPPVITINASAPTFISSKGNSTVFAYSGYLFPASTGAVVVKINGPNDQRFGICAGVFAGVSTASPVGTTANSTGTSSTPNITVSASVGDLVVAGFSYLNDATTKRYLSTVSGEDVIAVSSGTAASSAVAIGMFSAPGAGSVAMNSLCAGGAAKIWVAHGFVLNAATAAPSGGFISWWY